MMTDIPEIRLESRDVTCVTDGCENEGVTLTVLVNGDAPVVQCGPCGAWLVPPGTEPQPEGGGA